MRCGGCWATEVGVVRGVSRRCGGGAGAGGSAARRSGFRSFGTGAALSGTIARSQPASPTCTTTGSGCRFPRGTVPVWGVRASGPGFGWGPGPAGGPQGLLSGAWGTCPPESGRSPSTSRRPSRPWTSRPSGTWKATASQMPPARGTPTLPQPPRPRPGRPFRPPPPTRRRPPIHPRPPPASASTSVRPCRAPRGSARPPPARNPPRRTASDAADDDAPRPSGPAGSSHHSDHQRPDHARAVEQHAPTTHRHLRIHRRTRRTRPARPNRPCRRERPPGPRKRRRTRRTPAHASAAHRLGCHTPGRRARR